jgi:hypothetical protein
VNKPVPPPPSEAKNISAAAPVAPLTPPMTTPCICTPSALPSPRRLGRREGRRPMPLVAKKAADAATAGAPASSNAPTVPATSAVPAAPAFLYRAKRGGGNGAGFPRLREPRACAGLARGRHWRTFAGGRPRVVVRRTLAGVALATGGRGVEHALVPRRLPGCFAHSAIYAAAYGWLAMGR